MRPALHAAALVTLACSAGVPLGAQEPTPSLQTILARAGERVEEFLVRAQSLMCVETVRLQPLDSGLGPAGFGRTVESELRLSWDPLDEAATLTEARSLRQVLKVNGRKPRENDYDSCTSPEQQTSEPQPLALLLPEQREDYTFVLGKPRKLDGRPTFVVDYKERGPITVSVHEIEGKDDCISFSVEGGQRGRIWIDPVTFEVLRLDQGTMGLVEIPMPEHIARRPGVSDSWTLERMDTSIRFKPVSFQDPPETLVLPVASTSLRITRGSGTPRLRTITQYVDYRRFLTGARLVQQ